MKKYDMLIVHDMLAMHETMLDKRYDVLQRDIRALESPGSVLIELTGSTNDRETRRPTWGIHA
jgi:hypothetical protein